MAASRTCAKCGATLSAGSALDVCPQCVAPQVLSADTSPVTDGGANPPGTLLMPLHNPVEQPGDRIGRYKLLQKIGEGGCGVVYMAEQEEPVRRRVALKVIKLGMDTRQVIARFEAERQALAMMDHPNIAKVHDGGTTTTGRPYFVMELVRGVRMTDYCDENNLSTSQRLDLFMQVCHAVQHAHQKGIIHRDLKPSNILVTINDGVPVPKVIDFGVAKAVEQRLTDKTLFTEFHQFIGTPAYMSPEQALMTSLDIDTRSDIYSLGVLLYELLTGRTPLDTPELLKAGLDEMRRTIREQEPPRPSNRLSTLPRADLTSTAKRRSTNPPQLIHAVSGDLDWIVMKCLEKDRTRRYETANGLAADLKRHLNNEPIVARPASAAYRFRKVVQRNKLAFTAATGIALALLAGAIVSTWQAVRAHRESRRALAAEAAAKTEAASSEQVARFLARMLEGVGPSVALGRDTTLLREILARTEKRLSEDLADQPEVEARLRVALARVYFELQDFPKAEAMANRVLELRPKLNGGEHKQVREALQDLGDIYLFRGEYVRSEAMHREGLALLRRLRLDGGKTEALQLNSLANALDGRGDRAGAEALYREALELRQREDGEGLVSTLLINLAMVRDNRGDHAEAERLGRQVLEMLRKKHGAGHPELAIALSNLANALKSQGKLEEAEKFSREAVAMLRKLMGGVNPGQVKTMETLVTILQAKGDLAEAESLSREALAIRRQAPANDDGLADTLTLLTIVLMQREKWAEAERHARDALAIWRKLHDPGQKDVLNAMNNVAFSLRQQGRLAEAERMYRDCLAERNPSTKPSRRRMPLANLIAMLAEQGKENEAVSLLQEEWKLARENMDDDTKKREDCLADFADMFSQCHLHAEAEPIYRELIASRSGRLALDHDDVVSPKASLGRLLANWAWAERSLAPTNDKPLQRAREAERLLRECRAIRKSQLNMSRGRLGDTRSRFGGALLSLAFLEPALPPENREASLREAEAEMLAGQDLMTQSTSLDRKYRRHGLERLVRLYEAGDKPIQADEWREKLDAFDQ